MAFYKEHIMVGHGHHNLAPKLSSFLRTDINKVFAHVTGDKVNRGAGYGLEIPCVCHYYGPKAYIDRNCCWTSIVTNCTLLIFNTVV